MFDDHKWLTLLIALTLGLALIILIVRKVQK